MGQVLKENSPDITKHIKIAEDALREDTLKKKELNYTLFLRMLIYLGENNDKENASLVRANQESTEEIVASNQKQNEEQNADASLNEEQESTEEFNQEQIKLLVSLMVFESVWKGAEEAEQAKIGEEEPHLYFAANFNFNKDRKAKVDRGLTLFKETLKINTDSNSPSPAADSDENPSPVKENPDTTLLQYMQEGSFDTELNIKVKKAYKAISKYQTRTQKAVHYIGMFLAGAISVAFGAIESGTAFIFLLPIFLAHISVVLPSIVIYLIASPFLALATYVEWRIFKSYVPDLLKEIIGKDQVLDGITKYSEPDPQKDKNQDIIMQAKELSTGRKIGLAAFTFLAAIPTGIAIGALGYTSTLAIGSLPILGTFIATAGLSAILPPLGIALAALVAISLTCMLVKSFSNLLHSKSAWDAFTKPIKEVTQVLNDKKSSTPTKVIVYAITALIALASVIGLALACKASTHSLGVLLSNSINIAPTVAFYLASAIALGSAFIGRVWTTIVCSGGAVATLLKRILIQNKDPEASNSNLIDSNSAVTNNAATEAQTSKNKNIKQIIFAIVEAVMEIFFYAQNAMSTGASVVMTFLTGDFTGTRTLTLNLAHVDDPEKDPEEVKVKKNIQVERVGNLKKQMDTRKGITLDTRKGITFFSPARNDQNIETATKGKEEIVVEAKEKPGNR